MWSESVNRLLCAFVGLAALVIACLSTLGTFVTSMGVIVVVGFSTFLCFGHFNYRHVHQAFEGFLPFGRSSTQSGSKSSSSSKTISRRRGNLRESTMRSTSDARLDTFSGTSKLGQSFRAVKSLLTSSGSAFGVSSPVLSARGTPASVVSRTSPASLPRVHRIRDRYCFKLQEAGLHLAKKKKNLFESLLLPISRH